MSVQQDALLICQSFHALWLYHKSLSISAFWHSIRTGCIYLGSRQTLPRKTLIYRK